MKERVVVICTLVRDGPSATPCAREFCADCRARVWLSEITREQCRDLDVRPLPVCVACGRVRIAGDEEAEFVETTSATVRAVAKERGCSEEEARRIADFWVDEWRAGRG